MSLYAHVPGKDDLVALMTDAVYAELYDDDVNAAASQGDWRVGMTYVAQRNWELYGRHPWLLDLRPTTPMLGPNISRKYETELRPLDGIGLSDLAIDSALSLILSHVEATARAGRHQDDSGMTDAEWWSIAAPVLEQVMSDTDLQVSARVGAAVGAEYDATSASPDHALMTGLTTILDGIQVAIDHGQP